MNKRCFLISAFIILGGGILFLACQNTSPSKSTGAQSKAQKGAVVARVGDFVITEDDVEKHKKRMPRIGKLSKENVIEDLITTKLLYLGAKKENSRNL
ncbi:hypothetical protein ACFL27_25515, partial [candidate division CSSED10-310 bacterium]